MNISSSLSVKYSAASGTKTVVALLTFLDDKFAVKHFVPVLILPDFLLRQFHFGVTFLDGFG